MTKKRPKGKLYIPWKSSNRTFCCSQTKWVTFNTYVYMFGFHILYFHAKHTSITESQGISWNTYLALSYISMLLLSSQLSDKPESFPFYLYFNPFEEAIHSLCLTVLHKWPWGSTMIHYMYLLYHNDIFRFLAAG